MAGMWTLSSASYRAPASPPRPTAVPCTASDDGSSRPPTNGGLPSGPGGNFGRPPFSFTLGLPEPPATLPELQKMSLDDLRAMHHDMPKFHHFINSHGHTQQVKNTIAAIRQDVERLEEEKNKRYRDSQNDGVVSEQDIGDLDCKIIEMRAQVDALQKERDDWVARNTGYHLEQRLRVLIDETEQESEALLEQWHNDLIDYAEFMPKYIAVRTKVAERKLKLCTFQEKVQQGRLAAGTSQMR